MVLNKKITVLQVLPDLNSGGVEKGTLEVNKYLTKKGHRSIVISNGGRMVDELIKNNIKRKIPIQNEAKVVAKFIKKIWF